MNYANIETAGNLNDRSLCYIANEVEGMVKGKARMTLGLPARKLFPKPATIRLRDEDPGMRLPGFIGNRHGQLIFNPAGRAVIERLCVGAKIEYLPFDLINHKGRVHSSDYVIVNPLGGFDALNEDASQIVRADDDGRILSIPKIVLDTDKLEKAPHLFRLKQKPIVYAFSETLMQALKDAAVDNLIWRPFAQARPA